MARTLEETPLTTRNARSKLRPGVYWRAVDATVHLGYRRGARGGVWLVRWRNGKGYRQDSLGAADDALDADGTVTLTYSQAVIAGRDLVEARRASAAFEAAGPTPTVRIVCESYADLIEERQRGAGRSVLKDARSRIRVHVLSDVIADVELPVLTAADIRGWRDRVRQKTSAETTMRRIATDLRSALRRAETEFRGKLPERYLDELRVGFAVDTRDPPARSARPNIVLPDADVRRLLDAARRVDTDEGWDGDLFRLTLGLAATGARFSQLARVTVADLQVARKRLMVPSSGKGRGAKKQMHVAVPLGEDVLAELARAAAERETGERLFMRWGYDRGQRLRWIRGARRSWAPSDLTKTFQAIVAQARLSPDVTAYSLRHSGIVRGLRAGLPVRLVAALHDTSTAMIERHYSAFIVDAMEELAARAVVPLIG